MPIYEFYCRDCHTIFNFLARRPDVSKRPSCPRCNRPELERKLSRFAISKNRPEPSAEGDLPSDFDESKMEQILSEMGDLEGMNEEDPRQMARMMRKIYDATGMPMGEQMEEAMRRMEAGEDPDKIEEEMGDLLEGEEPAFGTSGRNLREMSRYLLPPNEDQGLYDL